MKNKILLNFFIAFWGLLSVANASPESQPGTYKMVVEGFDWGPAVNKIILSLPDTTSKVLAADYTVFVQRKLSGYDIPAEQSSGKRDVISAYISNESGERVKTGKNITLVLSVGPSLPIASPFQYVRAKGNLWVDYNLTIIQSKTHQIWNKSTGKIMPLIDEFDLSKKFSYQDKTMAYATYSPKNRKDKAPLIIWLHGGGEGGMDPTVPLLGNKAANYAGSEIQTIWGRIRPNEPTLDRDAPAGQIATINLPTFVKKIGVKDRAVTEFYLVLGENNFAKAGLPKLLSRPQLDEGNHLSYAMQWIIFAVMAFIALVWAVRQEVRFKRMADDPNYRPKVRKKVGDEDKAVEDAL